MTDSEKWAWLTLFVVTLTATAYIAYVGLVGNGPAAQAVFALMALTAIPASSRRHLKGCRLDERERGIANTALLAAFRALLVAFIAAILTIGFSKGWDTSINVPLWVLSATICWAAIFVLTVEAVTTLVLYRRRLHA